MASSTLPNRARRLLGSWARALRISPHTAVLVTAGMIGVLSGVGNAAYRKLVEWVHFGVFEALGPLLGVKTYFPGLLLLPLLPLTGAAVLLLLDAVFPGDVRGYGFPRFLELVNLRGGVLRARATLAKTLASAVTIGSGGSAGMESPIAQIGGTIGSLIGQAMKVGQIRLRTLVACGVAAGIGGTFNAPIAGVFFAEEIVLLRSFSAASFAPLVISSGVGTLVVRMLEGNRPAFYVPHYILRDPREIALYAGLGLVLGLAAVHFVRSFYAVSDWFEALAIPNRVKPFLGAGATGVIGIFLFEVLGNGYEHIEHAMAGRFTAWLLVALALAKMYATGLTLGSGNAGGIFAPSLFIGAMIGGAYGALVHRYFPETTAGAGAYALVGMGGFLAAATHAPMTAIFLIFEMTNEYSAILPIMFTSVIGYTVSRRFLKKSIDTLDLARRGIQLEEGFEVSVLESIPVRLIMNPRVEVVPEAMPLKGLLKFIPGSRQVTFPVVDTAGKLTGILSLQDFREVAYEEGLGDLVVAKELATANVLTAFPDESVRAALAKIGLRNIEHLPVVSRDDPRVLVGMLSRRDIIAAYNKALVERSLGAEES